jgi:Domain of Unknown Function (DUF1206)
VRSLVVRFGLAAIGTIYVALGLVSARVALLGVRDREAGVPGALLFLVSRPFGPKLLGAVVAGLTGLAAVRLVEAFGRRRRRGAWTRAGLVLNGIGYAILAWTAARLLWHLGQGGSSLERSGIRWLLGVSWGAALLEVVGAGVILGGAYEAMQGARGRLPLRGSIRPRALAPIGMGIARFGLIARGLVLGALGVFVVRAAERLDPNGIRTVGGALDAFSKTALGPLFTGVVALGLSAYGVYVWMLALTARKV